MTTEQPPRTGRWLEALRSCRRVSLDTSAVIYELQSVAPYAGLTGDLFEMMRRGLMVATISTVVQAEVLVKPFRDRDLRAIENATLFFRESVNLAVRSVDPAVARVAARVRAATRLPLPDSLIVATAIEERCDALVGNDRVMANRVRDVPYLLLDDYVG